MANWKIAEYKLENFMYMRELALTPEGNLVVFTGKNKQGKGSSLKGVPFVLGGAKFEPEKPGLELKPGEQERYMAQVVLEEISPDPIRLIATRTTRGGLKVEVEPKAKRWGTDQNMLSSLISKMGLDPMDFVYGRYGKKQMKRFDAQREWLSDLGILQEDFTSLEQRIEDIEKRDRPAAKNRSKEKWAQAGAIALQPDLPASKIDVDAIRARLKEIREHNRQVELQAIERAGLATRLGNVERAYSDNQRTVEQLKEKITARLGVKVDEAQRARDDNQDAIENLQAEIGGAEAEIQAREPIPAQAVEIRDGLEDLTEKARRLAVNNGELVYALDQAYGRAVRYITAASESVDGLRKQINQRRQELSKAEETAGRLGQELAEAQRALEQAPAVTPGDRELEQHGKALAAAEQHAGRLEQELAAARQALEQAPALERRDDEAAEAELADAEKKNREIDRRTRREDLEKEAKAAEAEWEALGAEKDQAKDRIDAAYRNAAMPMAGLTFTSEGARFDGILLEDLGEALQIEIGMRVALAGNPPLRLVIIPNGEALDDDNKLKIAKLAQELDCEVWMSCVNFSEREEETIAAEAPMTVATIEAGRAKKISKRKPAGGQEGSK